MMYMHYCNHCQHIFMLNGHKIICPKCIEPLTELRISYLDYINLNMEQRNLLQASCTDEQKLNALSNIYRMYKYSKWYKELQMSNSDELPIAMILAEHIRQDWSESPFAEQTKNEAIS